MNVIGFDDGPFPREHRGDVLVVGVVCSATRVDGIVSGRIRRDGVDSTRRVVELVRASQFGTHVQAVMFQGIAMGGFNVIDIHGLSHALKIPVLVVVRKLPDMDAVKRALFSRTPTSRPAVPGATRKWELIQKAGSLEPLGVSRRSLKRQPSGLATAQKLYIQRAGLSLEEARRLVMRTTLHGNIPEPLRLAHLIAGGVTTGKSRGRAREPGRGDRDLCQGTRCALENRGKFATSQAVRSLKDEPRQPSALFRCDRVFSVTDPRDALH